MPKSAEKIETTYDPLIAPDPAKWLAMDEQERMVEVRNYHMLNNIPLPDADVHALIHALVETHAAAGDETPVRAKIAELMKAGVDRHEAVHAIAMVLAEHIFGAISNDREGCVAKKDDALFENIRKLTLKDWQQIAVE